jgi:hypothetical protein
VYADENIEISCPERDLPCGLVHYQHGHYTPKRCEWFEAVWIDLQPVEKRQTTGNDVEYIYQNVINNHNGKVYSGTSALSNNNFSNNVKNSPRRRGNSFPQSTK